MEKLKNKLIFKFVLTLILFTAGISYGVSSQVGSAEDLGLGVALGQPMGFTAKYWLSPTAAVDGVIGYHWNSNFDMHADYLWHSFSSFNVASGRLPFYVGLGSRVLLGDDSQLGIRFPLGITYLFPNDPVELFAEIAPVMKITSGIGGDIDGILGVRFYINYMR